jgi:hypothetical protein
VAVTRCRARRGAGQDARRERARRPPPFRASS